MSSLIPSRFKNNEKTSSPCGNRTLDLRITHFNYQVKSRDLAATVCSKDGPFRVISVVWRKDTSDCIVRHISYKMLKMLNHNALKLLP